MDTIFRRIFTFARILWIIPRAIRAGRLVHRHRHPAAGCLPRLYGHEARRVERVIEFGRIPAAKAARVIAAFRGRGGVVIVVGAVVAGRRIYSARALRTAHLLAHHQTADAHHSGASRWWRHSFALKTHRSLGRGTVPGARRRRASAGESAARSNVLGEMAEDFAPNVDAMQRRMVNRPRRSIGAR